MKRREGQGPVQVGVVHLCPSSWAALVHEVPVTASQCKQETGTIIFPVKGVPDALTAEHVPSFSADHQKGGVPVLTDPGKGQGKCEKRLYLVDS